MTKPKPTKEEQILALMQWKAYDLAQRYASKKTLDEAAYKEVFSIKRADIVDYLKKHAQPTDLIQKDPKKDGFYLRPTTNGYIGYVQDTGFKISEEEFGSIEDIWNKYADYLIRTSGTAIDFDK